MLIYNKDNNTNCWGGFRVVNGLVVKSNKLIEARYTLSLNEQKLILYAASKLDRNDDKFNVLELQTREFLELLNTTVFRYTEIKELVTGLMSKQVKIETDERDLVANWISSIDYKKNTGIIELEFSVKLMPYLLQLKNRFTRYQLKNILYLKNKHSIRIYELMKQYQTIGHRTFTIEELKELLMLENKYPEFRDFNKSVIKPSMEEINEHTDINIDIELVKRGRKATGLKYTIQSKDDNSYITYLNQNYNIKEFKMECGIENECFDSKQVIELYTIATEVLQDAEQQSLFEYIKLNYLHMMKNKTVQNKFAYLKKALAEDYAVARGQLKFEYALD